MASGHVTKRAKYKSTIEDPGTPGTLRMTFEKILFVPHNPKSAGKLDVEFQYIKGKVCGKSGEVSEKPTVAYPDEQLSAAEMELQIKLLQEDSELQKLHKQFMLSGVLKEAEFWATRKLLDREARKKTKQRLGFKSAMISDIKPSTDGWTNIVTFNLTPEIILQIFAEKPAVHCAFLSYVPNKMSERNFWTKYFRAEYLHSTKNSIAAAAEAAEDEELAVFLKQDHILASRRGGRSGGLTQLWTWRLTRGMIIFIFQYVSLYCICSLNLNVDVELEDTRAVAEALAQSKQVSSTKGEPDRDTSQGKVSRMTEIEDLQGSNNLPLAPLCIKDPRDYFDSQQANALRTSGDAVGGTEQIKCCLSTQEVYGSLREFISMIKAMGLKEPIVKPEVAHQVFDALTDVISSTNHHIGKNAKESVLDRLPKKTKEELLHHWTSILELLRHFWASHSSTTTYLDTRVNRLKDAMSNIYPQIEEIKGSVPSDLRHQVSLLVSPMHQALDAAIQHYEAGMQKRSTQSGERPNGYV